MKRYATLFLSLLLLVSMTACGGQPADSSSPDGEESTPTRTPGLQIPEKGGKKPVGTKNPEQTSEQTSEQATDPDLAYSELVERFRAIVSDPFGQDSDKPGEMGVLESARAAGDNAVYEMGYLIEDLSGDGTLPSPCGAPDKSKDTSALQPHFPSFGQVPASSVLLLNQQSMRSAI